MNERFVYNQVFNQITIIPFYSMIIEILKVEKEKPKVSLTTEFRKEAFKLIQGYLID